MKTNLFSIDMLDKVTGGISLVADLWLWEDNFYKVTRNEICKIEDTDLIWECSDVDYYKLLDILETIDYDTTELDGVESIGELNH